MNTFELAFKELEREGRKPSDKSYGMLWERRVRQINNYILKMDAKKTRRN
jgi:hypothetical protein